MMDISHGRLLVDWVILSVNSPTNGVYHRSVPMNGRPGIVGMSSKGLQFSRVKGIVLEDDFGCTSAVVVRTGNEPSRNFSSELCVCGGREVE